MSKKQSRGTAYRNYVLASLTVVYAFNFIDRQLLVILQESIKMELGFSDTQLGLLSGFTFAIFYVTMGIPIARLADRGNRRNVVAVSLALWSAMTAVTGLVQNFFQILLARIGVGVGEAGGSPPAHAMISDYFPPEKRGSALAIYSTGIYLGVLLGSLLGGFFNEYLGWRLTFVLLGVPGVLFAGLLYTTVKEPRRGAADPEHFESQHSTYTMREVANFLLSKKSFLIMALATGLHSFSTYAVGNWMPSFMYRIHEMTNMQVGLSIGLIIGLGGAIGTFASGKLADILGQQDRRWYFRIPAFAAFAAIPFVTSTLLTDSVPVMLVSLTGLYICYTMFLPPCLAITHNMVPPQMRALSSAILFFVLNLIGLGLGPLTIGYLSDMLTPIFGVNGIRWAMMSTVFVTATGAVLFLVAGKFIDTNQ